MAELISTVEAATRIGASPKKLRRWQRQGYLTPQTTGDGTGRRLMWSERDIKEAKELMHQDSRKSRSDATIDALGGDAFYAAFKRAQDVIETALPGEVVIAGPNGARVFQPDEPIGRAMRTIGSIAVLITNPPA